MSVSQVREMLQASITAYNEKKRALHTAFFQDNEHSESWKAEQRQRKQKELKNEYAANLVDIQNRLSKAESNTALQVGRIKFPLVSSTLNENRTVGELQRNSAELYLAREHSHAGILSSIRSALMLGRVDYAFSVIEGAREAVKPVNGMLSQEGKQFLQDLAQIEQGFDTTGNLGALAGELAGVPEIVETLKGFQAFLMNENLMNENLTGSYIPFSAVRGMTEAEVRANLESVNFAVSQQRS